jgi:Spy/CpxP family protein refolding chaperone
MMTMVDRLDLTGEQRQKLRSIRNEAEKKRIGLKAQMDVADVELRQLKGANEVDLEKVRKKLNERASKDAELRFSAVKMDQDIKGLLTDAQLDELRVLKKGSHRSGRPGGPGRPGRPGGPWGHECGHVGR